MEILNKKFVEEIELMGPATPFDKGETLQPMAASSFAEYSSQVINLSNTSSKSESVDESKAMCALCLPCLPGEEVIHSAYTQQGLLVLTDYRLVIIRHSSHATILSDNISHCNESSLLSNSPSAWSTYLIARQSIWKVDVIDLLHLRIIIKTGRLLKITFLDCAQCQTWYGYLQPEVLNQIGDREPFVVKFKVELSKREERLDPKFRRLLFEAPLPINVESEFRRLEFPSHLWELKNINEDYAICKTYPICHIVPKSMTAANVREMAPFRQNNRFPSVVWRSVHSGAVLLRCSQPCVGFMGFRNKQDEKFLLSVLQCCQEDREILQHGQHSSAQGGAASHGGGRLLIVDARNYSAAFVNCLLGGGYEKVQNYANVDIEWKNLPNQHSVRASFEKMLVCVHSNVEQWLSVWENTEWPNYLSQLLKSSWEIVQTLHVKGNPVLVHCTDGWDRTPQLTSLAQLMLDPYYRTIEGFRVLVDREWLQYGHKFAQRCGLFTHSFEPNEISPIFIQFIDCVHQLCHQYPFEFEFNETFLIKLGVHLYSGLFGTFLCNSLLERSVYHSNTCSVWSFLHPQVNASVRNYLFKPSRKILMPSWSTRDIVLWRGMYGDEVNFFVDPHRDAFSGNSCLLVHPTDSFIAFSHVTNNDGQSEVLEEFRSIKKTPPSRRESVAYEKFMVPPVVRHNESGRSLGVVRSLSVPNVNFGLDNTTPLSTKMDDSFIFEEKPKANLDQYGFPLKTSNMEEYRNSEDVPIDTLVSSITSKRTNKQHIKLTPLIQRKMSSSLKPSLTGSSHGVTFTDESPLLSSSVEMSTSESVPHFDAIIKRPSTFSGELFVNQVVPLPPTSSSQSCVCINTLLHRRGDENSPEICGKSRNAILEVQQDWDGLNHINMRVDPHTSYIYLQRQSHTKERQKLQQEVNHWKNQFDQLTEEFKLLMQKVEISPREELSLSSLLPLSTSMARREVDSGMASDGTNGRLNSFVNVEKNEMVLWIPDHMSTSCGQCRTPFGPFLRKHHCRACGHIFCWQCSNYFTCIPQQNLLYSERVCQDCYNKLTMPTSNNSEEVIDAEPSLNVSRSVSQVNGSTLYSLLLPLTPWILRGAHPDSVRQQVKSNENLRSLRSNSLEVSKRFSTA